MGPTCNSSLGRVNVCPQNKDIASWVQRYAGEENHFELEWRFYGI